MGTRSAFVGREPVRIQIEGDERWIAIKPKLGQGDRLHLLDVLLENKALTGTASLVSIAKWGAFVEALMEASIMDWWLPNGSGEAMPFNRVLIAQLDPDDPLVEKVSQEVVERNPLLGRAQPKT